MKKIVSVFIAAIMIILGALPFAAFAEEPENVETVPDAIAAAPADAPSTGRKIMVYNWGQYIADGSEDSLDINAEFTRRTGIEVVYRTFDTNESLYTTLKTGGVNIDVIIPSDYMIARLIAENMLEEIDYSNIPNYEKIGYNFKNLEFDPSNQYSVPYMWGTVGIIYNSKHVDEADAAGESWDLLWNEKYKGKILMFDNPRDSFGIASLKLGNDINATDSTKLNIAADELKKQRPLIQQYVMDQIFDLMEQEEAWIAPYYAGDFITMSESNAALKFYFPKEGFNKFVDSMCIPKGAQNKADAEAYINFISDAEISAANSDFLGYSTPNTAAMELLDPELAQNEIAYPSDAVLEKGQTFLNLPDETLHEMDSLWLTVKASQGTDESPNAGVPMWIWYVAIGAVAVFIIALLVALRQKRKKAYDEI